jgi:cell division protein FtsZ
MKIQLVQEANAKIKVVGIGGAGGNAINNMIRSSLRGVEFVAANTDLQSLENSLSPVKLQLGANLTKGLGAGGNPEIGREAALEDADLIRETLKNCDMVFITAGLGGGTGTGAGPIVAQIAKELGALTVGVVTKPFNFEGKKRHRQAEEGFRELKKNVDTLICIPNDRLLALAPKKATFVEMLKKADEVLLYAVKGVSDLIMVPGIINLDFADVRTVMAEMGVALMGTGISSGENRAHEAASLAISSPLLEDVSIAGAKGVLVNICCSAQVTMEEMVEASALIQKEAHEEANIFWGAVIDDQAGEEFRVTVIATGIGSKEKEGYMDSASRVVRPIFPERKPVEFLERPTFQRKEKAVDKWGPKKSPGGDTLYFDEEEMEIPTFIRKNEQ